MTKTLFTGDAVCQEFELEALAAEERLDHVVFSIPHWISDWDSIHSKTS